MSDEKKESSPGPEADRLKIDEDWESAVQKALNKPKPEEGWPEDVEQSGGDDDAD
ncbi:hypothetical protein [Algisphaera agarilytica]|uniref:Uncharacterized protein n=1 Tax=Algisphaera agarilytica TaxID=1385975 RepID=A0A7X0H3D6_9BACT|nr:hypothetical protein [Algisphaera agarilytica]MBB6428464.1 hypothetical protein [Algisphaera agarilytica]